MNKEQVTEQAAALVTLAHWQRKQAQIWESLAERGAATVSGIEQWPEQEAALLRQWAADVRTHRAMSSKGIVAAAEAMATLTDMALEAAATEASSAGG